MVFAATASGDTPPTNSFTPPSWTPGLRNLTTFAVHRPQNIFNQMVDKLSILRYIQPHG